MIKYLGSKKKLVPFLADLARSLPVQSAVDLFTGTTRVAQAFKAAGLHTTACDLASYSEIFAQCYIGTDAKQVDYSALEERLAYLSSLPGRPGYVTETFCHAARFFQPHNGQRIDAIREELAGPLRSDPYYPILLTSLIEAADRVDSTTGVQMAYLKDWSPRSYNDLQLRLPELLAGPGVARRGDAMELVDTLPEVDLMYLDPPYNQHRYFSNYHIWETLVQWDMPTAYGVAQKRLDCREAHTKSVFNSKRDMAPAFFDMVCRARARYLVVSHNNESWITPEQMQSGLRQAGFEQVEVFAFDYKRYVGAQIGIYSPGGNKVGKVSHLKNQELIFLAAPAGTPLPELADLQAGTNHPH